MSVQAQVSVNETCSEGDGVNFMTFGDLTVDHRQEQLHICTMSYQRLKAVLSVLKESGAAGCLRDGVLDSEDGGVGICKLRPITNESTWSHAEGEASFGMAHFAPSQRASEELAVKKSAEKLIQKLTIQCANCNSVPQMGQKFQKCSKCKQVSYCRRECQVLLPALPLCLCAFENAFSGCTLEEPQD